MLALRSIKNELDTLDQDSDEDSDDERTSIKDIVNKIYLRTNQNVANVLDKLKLLNLLVDHFCENIQAPKGVINQPELAFKTRVEKLIQCN